MRPLPRELCCLWYAALQAELLPPVCSDLSLQLDVTTSERFLHMWSHRNCFHFPGSITDVPAEQGQCFQLTVDELSDTDGPEPPGGTARFTLVGHHIICVSLVTSSKMFQNKCCCTVTFSNWIKWYDQHKNYTIYSIHTYIHTYIDIYIYTYIHAHIGDWSVDKPVNTFLALQVLHASSYICYHFDQGFATQTVALVPQQGQEVPTYWNIFLIIKILNVRHKNGTTKTHWYLELAPWWCRSAAVVYTLQSAWQCLGGRTVSGSWRSKRVSFIHRTAEVC